MGRERWKISTYFGTRDRRRYLHWLFEAKKRFGLCVLDYMVTSNHIHLLVKDTGSNAIAESMQLIAGRTSRDLLLPRPDEQGDCGVRVRLPARESDGKMAV